MANRIRRALPALAGVLILAAGCGAGAAAHAQPVYKDLERFGTLPAPRASLLPPSLAYAEPETGRPARRLNGGPGYVGSDYGLGKPSVTGLGTRPDWGRSGE